MRCLRTRWHIAALTPRAGRAVADCKDPVVARRLQCRPNDELIDAVGFKTSDVFQEIGRLDSRCPRRSIRRGSSGRPSRAHTI